ncbi:MAG: LEPR-XLL domain-containing protein [Planctomycetes bacterium]|nr:LEPR-XLL domain-containing protein [Planctomycetota bacterium]
MESLEPRLLLSGASGTRIRGRLVWMSPWPSPSIPSRRSAREPMRRASRGRLSLPRRRRLKDRPVRVGDCGATDTCSSLHPSFAA